MRIEDCYAAMGGDYLEVLNRFGKAERVRRFLLKFPKDQSFSQLGAALEVQDGSEAYRMAHSLKGISANLGLLNLYESVRVLSDTLRDRGIDDRTQALFEQAKADYDAVIDHIEKLDIE